MVINTTTKNLLFSTVCIEGANKSNSKTTGTGFLMSHEIAGYGLETFLVTNKHVVAGIECGKICFTRKVGGEPVLGHTFAFECGSGFGGAFHGHPEETIDVAVLPISFLLRVGSDADRDAFITPISTKLIPSQDEIKALDAVLPVMFVGYPNGLYDSVNRTPIVRRGITATPVELDFDGLPNFLIDASVFPGSSGSPVFTHTETIGGQIDGLRLLGIVAQVLVRKESGELRFAPAPTSVVPQIMFNQMIDLGVVVKSRLIVEAIEDCWKHKAQELQRAKGQHSPHQAT